MLIYYYLWRFFSAKSDGDDDGGALSGRVAAAGGGGDGDSDGDDDDAGSPSQAVSPKARDRQAMERAITALPVFVVHIPSPSGVSTSASGDGGAADDASSKVAAECAICIAEFADGEEGRLLPRCGHRFHARCVDMWFQLHSTCPLCRAAVLPPPPPREHDDGQAQAVAVTPPPPDAHDASSDNCPV
ncbi:E3 ubiquitin-protein ligase EL5-like [Oryza brachyantha]|uniref:E3 ubiquitin-protein ligase EL5-like n=1 Tax=Oryza brachyantha TaxID=4533 RepID=UPI001AD9FE0F|nr:E3 ubiquitin-protein ligase EL5-like [Oryza brachyantha]